MKFHAMQFYTEALIEKGRFIGYQVENRFELITWRKGGLFSGHVHGIRRWCSANERSI